MIRMNLQLFGGRGGSSGGGGGGGSRVMNEEVTSENSQYKVYDDRGEAENDLMSSAWNDSLSISEEHAVERYTSNDYHWINGELRGNNPLYMSEPQLKELHTDIDNLTNAIDRYELQNDTVFHRGAGTKLLNGASTLSEVQAMMGSTVIDKGFTSSGVTVYESFTHKPLMFHIMTPKGKGIGAYIGKQNIYGEKEFLFNRGSAFKIVGAYADAYGKVNVNLQYIGNTR